MHPDPVLAPLLQACRLLDHTARAFRRAGLPLSCLTLYGDRLEAKGTHKPRDASAHRVLQHTEVIGALPALHRRLMDMLAPAHARALVLAPESSVPEGQDPVVCHPLIPVLEANGHGALFLRVGSRAFKHTFRSPVGHASAGHAALAYALFLASFAHGATTPQGPPKFHRVRPQPLLRGTLPNRHEPLEIFAHEPAQAAAMCEALCHPHRYLAGLRGALDVRPVYDVTVHTGVPRQAPWLRGT